MFITTELMGNVWYGRSKDNDSLVALPDGSDHLTYDPKTKQVRTGTNARAPSLPSRRQRDTLFNTKKSAFS